MLFNLFTFLKAELINVTWTYTSFPSQAMRTRQHLRKKHEIFEAWERCQILPQRDIRKQAELSSQTLIKGTHTCVHSNDFGQIPGRCKPIRHRLQVQDAVYMESLSLWNNFICSCQLNLVWDNMSCQQMRAMGLWEAGLVHFQHHSMLFNVSANASSILPSKCCSTTCFIGVNESHSKN